MLAAGAAADRARDAAERLVRLTSLLTRALVTRMTTVLARLTSEAMTAMARRPLLLALGCSVHRGDRGEPGGAAWNRKRAWSQK